MKRFYTVNGIRSIPEEEIGLIEEQAGEGDPLACYKLAQLHLAWHFESDYAETAQDLLKKAQQGGIADADAAMALMYLRGEIEPYNPSEGARLLEKAVNNESGYAAFTHLCNMIYGRYGYTKNLELAIRILDSFLEVEEDPYWYMLKGDAVYESGRREEAVYCYEKALEGGLTEVYSDLAVARGLDPDGELVDWDAYEDTLQEGMECEDMMCLHFTVLNKCSEYDECDPNDDESRKMYRDFIVEGLEACADDNIVASCELLGDIYREGLYDVPVDLIKAWKSYTKGSQYYKGSCFEKMYDMLLCDEIKLGSMTQQEAMDLCAINGARLHNDAMIRATADAYMGGRLTQFAGEIEMYHLPAYNALPEDDEFLPH